MRKHMELSTVLHAPPQLVWDAFFDPKQHELLTGAATVIRDQVGSTYSLWSGSVTGEVVFVEKPRRAALTWRTDDFAPHMESSRVELGLQSLAVGTRLTVIHGYIPQELFQQFTSGWKDFYFPKLQQYVVNKLANR